jgi:hypothetical protein
MSRKSIALIVINWVNYNSLWLIAQRFHHHDSDVMPSPDSEKGQVPYAWTVTACSRWALFGAGVAWCLIKVQGKSNTRDCCNYCEYPNLVNKSAERTMTLAAGLPMRLKNKGIKVPGISTRRIVTDSDSEGLSLSWVMNQWDSDLRCCMSDDDSYSNFEFLDCMHLIQHSSSNYSSLHLLSNLKSIIF